MKTAASPTSTLSFCWHSRVSFYCFINTHRAHAITNGNDRDTAPGAVFLGFLGLGTTTHRKYPHTVALVENFAGYPQVPMSVLSWDFGDEANGKDLLYDRISVVVLIVVSLFTILFS